MHFIGVLHINTMTQMYGTILFLMRMDARPGPEVVLLALPGHQQL